MHARPPVPLPPRRSIGGGAILALLLAALAPAQDTAFPPLARYVPADRLAILVEHDGLDARAAAWKATATAKMLAETPLGGMLEAVTTQVLDRTLAGVAGPQVTGRDVLDLVKHLARRGFVVGYCGTVNPPEPRAVALVIRGAEANPTFKKLIALVPPLNEPAATKVEQGGRTVFLLQGVPARWWYEKGDFVASFAPPDGPDPVADTLDGKAPSALTHPARVELAKAAAGDVPVGRLFVDVAALPPLPAEAFDMGLDAVKRIDARWSIRGPAVSAMLAVQAPRPRKGLLSLFDQPAIPAGTGVKLPAGQVDSTLLSVDPVRSLDAILALVQKSDPDSAAAAARAAEDFQKRSGLSFRDDILAKLGPRAAIAPPANGMALGMIGMWIAPPDLGAVIELKDAAKFAANLDRLMDSVNRELKAAGGVVPPAPGRPKDRPGLDYAEFRRLKGPERGYILAVPPGVLPTPAGARPTVLVDPARGLLALGMSPDAARRALGSLVLSGAPAPTAPADTPRPGEFVRVRYDSSAVLTQLLANIPAVVQFAAIAAANQPNGPGRRGGPPLRLEIDPDSIPEPGVLRPFLFPTRYALAADDAAIRMTLDMAFPLPIPAVGSGVEAPILVALLLPAVQSAREAARRSQCVNNLKQVGLGMHNYESAHGHFPAAAITNEAGKSLLSWRVAILPYIEQQELYEKFKLDEPWDSPHNKELIAEMPAIYHCPSRPVPEPGMTTYRVFTSEGALFDPIGVGPTIAGVTDGTSNTLMVVEANEAVSWTKPEGLDAGKPGEAPPLARLGVGSKHPGGFNALFADGSVHFLKRTINRQTLAALITRALGEVVAADQY